MNEKIINLSDDIAKHFTKDALEEVNKDFSELFLAMFSEARSISADEAGTNVSLKIDRTSWQRGKWYVLKRGKRQGRYGVLISILRLINIIIPIFAGYWLADAATNYSLVIGSLVLFMVTFYAQDRLEADK